jgi:hypothetical protein
MNYYLVVTTSYEFLSSSDNKLWYISYEVVDKFVKKFLYLVDKL